MPDTFDRTALRSLLDELAGPMAVVEQDGGPYDPTTITRLIDDVGVLGLAVPTRWGGAGGSVTDLGAVFGEAGRAVLRAPLLSTTLACALLFASGDEPDCDRLLPAIARGSVRATAAVVEDGAGWSDVPATTANDDTGEWCLDGTKTWVLDGEDASVFVVSAAIDGVATLFLVEHGGQVDPIDVGDPSRRVARLRLDATPAQLLGPAANPLAVVAAVGRALVAAEQAGVARRCLELATGTDDPSLAAEVERAETAAAHALSTADDEPDELLIAAGEAAAVCSPVAMRAALGHAESAGEADHAEVYQRRAATNAVLFGQEHLHVG